MPGSADIAHRLTLPVRCHTGTRTIVGTSIRNNVGSRTNSGALPPELPSRDVLPIQLVGRESTVDANAD